MLRWAEITKPSLLIFSGSLGLGIVFMSVNVKIIALITSLVLVHGSKMLGELSQSDESSSEIKNENEFKQCRYCTDR